MKKSLALSIVAVGCISAAEVNDLGQVEVSANSDIHALSTDVITQSDIDNSRSRTIADALRTQPGVYIEDSGMRNETKVNIRGFSNNRLGLFVDGIPVYVPYDKNIDYNRFLTYDISEINIQKGYVSPMLGANVMGGAINLVTKKPTSEFEGEMGAGIFSGKGHEEYINLGTSIGWFYGILSLSDKGRDYFRSAKDQEDPYNVASDSNKRANSNSKDRKINFKVGITPNDTDEYSFNYIAQRGEKGQPYYDGDINAPFVGRGAKVRHWYWPDWDKTSYYLMSKTAFANEFFTLKTKWYRDEFYNALKAYKNHDGSRAGGAPFDSSYTDHTTGGQIETDFKFNDNHILKLSAALKEDYHREYTSTNAVNNLVMEAQTQSYGFEYTWAINKQFTWVVGASYDKNKVKKAEMIKNNARDEWDKYDSNAFNPQTILYFTPVEGTNLYASVSQRSNMPTLKDRYSSKFGTFEPNPDLKPEKATNYEIGISQNLFNNSTMAKLALFHTDTKDYIASIDLANGKSKNVNIGKEKHTGAEFSVDSQVLDNLSVYASYTYIHARVEDLDSTANLEEKYVTDTPEHSIYASLTYSPFSCLDITPQVRFESKRYASTYAEYASYNNKRYTIADLKVAYRPIKNLELNVRVNNIFNEDYTYSYGYPAEGRNYYAGFKYSF